MAANPKKPPVPLVTPTPAAVATGAAVPVSAPTRPPDRSAPPTIPPPPPPPATAPKGSTQAQFNAFINAHPTMRKYAAPIQKWANAYGIDPVVAAALFWRESFSAAGKNGNPATIVSPAGAVGIGQIMPLHVGETAPWGTLTQADLTNPEKNIQWSMWFFAQKVQQYGTYDDAYNQGYNPGYTGPPLTSLVPKGYVPKGALTQGEQAQVTAGQQAANQATQAQLYDRWVIRKPDGTIGFAKITDPNKPPANVVLAGGVYVAGKTKTAKGPVTKQQYVGGVPLTLSQFQQAKSTYDAYYYQYLGRAASNKEVVSLLSHPQSSYQLTISLSKKPEFTRSPIYKAHANGVVGVARAFFGDQWKPSTPAAKNLIRRAIVENWDDATLKTNLQNMPEYLKGPMYQDTVSKFTNVYQTIYGIPGQNSQQIIKEAAAKGWSADEFASWLRAQPAYTSSAEYQTKALDIATQLGLITGQMPSLAPGTLPSNPNPKSPLNPNTSRIPGQPKPIAPTTVGGNTLIVKPVGA